MWETLAYEHIDTYRLHWRIWPRVFNARAVKHVFTKHGVTDFIKVVVIRWPKLQIELWIINVFTWVFEVILLISNDKSKVSQVSSEFACNLSSSATRSCPIEHIFETPSDRVIIKDTGFGILYNKIVAITPLSCVHSSKHEHQLLSLVNNETKISRIGRISPLNRKNITSLTARKIVRSTFRVSSSIDMKSTET